MPPTCRSPPVGSEWAPGCGVRLRFRVIGPHRSEGGGGEDSGSPSGSEGAKTSVREAGRGRSAPFSVLHIASEGARAIYQRDLILLRPDLHVVWRGNNPPDNPAELAALATGNGRNSL